jgi:putative ubiquitin-RnfH superfamily antitoxin RatB of RatAB toxin-antitoxin module
MDSHCVQIQIVMARPERASVLSLTLPVGATVADALDRAAQSGQFDDIQLSEAPVGIFGRIVAPDHPLTQGDRIELYRPLAADPKTARRRRAASKSGRS